MAANDLKREYKGGAYPLGATTLMEAIEKLRGNPAALHSVLLPVPG